MYGVAFVGEGEQRLADDPQVLEVLVEFTEPRAELLDRAPHLLGLVGDGLFAFIDPPQGGLHGVGSGRAVVPVSRRVIMSVIVQYNGTQNSFLIVSE